MFLIWIGFTLFYVWIPRVGYTDSSPIAPATQTNYPDRLNCDRLNLDRLSSLDRSLCFQHQPPQLIQEIWRDLLPESPLLRLQKSFRHIP